MGPGAAGAVVCRRSIRCWAGPSAARRAARQPRRLRRGSAPRAAVGSPNTDSVTTRSPRCRPRVAHVGAWTGCLCVDGCGREWESASSGLCRAHAEQLRALRGCRYRRVSCPPANPPACAVRSVRGGRLHPPAPQSRRALLRRAPATAAHRPRQPTRSWMRSPLAVGPSRRSVAAVRSVCAVCRRWSSPKCWSGLQQRCRINAVKTDDAVLRAFCNDVRAGSRWRSLADYIPGDDRDLEFTGLANCLIGHARRALVEPGNRSRPRTSGI